MAASRHVVFDIPLWVLLALVAGGCGGNGVKPLVPDGAQLIRLPIERGIVAYEAGLPGTAYIVDVETGKVVFSVQMEIRDQLVAHPSKDMIFFNGNLVREGGLDPKRTYRLYFLQS